ncbi:phosphonopyruvate decarboxylase [Nocardioides campestrisoli]|uniref:phosphonopyruvate decarboxylase n=1 Tax=Nocardioides campestrisoli TaxID=2736757 RepID=UPI00163D6645|nr:phosphonopyruvate decarboxylase [Nocardioides campestrisoli]
MPGTPAGELVGALVARGVGPFVGVPCSLLEPVLSYVSEHHPELYLPVANEGEAVAVASGMRLAGGRPCVFLQNSGLGNAVNPLTSLSHTLRVPFLMLVGWRGEPGQPDEPQHRLMGSITEPLLRAMEIGHARLDDSVPVDRQVAAALDHLERTSLPYALLVPRNGVRTDVVRSVPDPGPARMRRDEAIGVLLRNLDPTDLVVSTTGRTSRELERDWDRPENLYVVGSMGCASSAALGVALAAPPGRRVVVLDGDGAALIRLEALTTIGRTAPPDFLHVVLDNGVHDSTGGQPTGAEAVDLVGVARACGYAAALDVLDAEHLASVVSTSHDSPTFVRLLLRPGADPDLGRPALAPHESARRFQLVAARG